MKNILRLFILALVLVLTLGVIPLAAADGSDWIGVVIAQRISQRESQSLSGKLVQNINNGEAVTILSEDNGWFNVTYNGKEGWVVSDYVVENPVYITLRNSNTAAFSYPNSDSKKVGSLTKYTKLLVISQTDNYWVVNLRQASAFISKKAEVWTDTDINNWLLHPPTEGTINKKTTLRTGPGTKWYDAVGMKAGDKVSILGSEDGWYVIVYDKAIAYVNMNDVDVTTPEG